MVVLRFREAEETGTTLGRAIKSGRMSAKSTEDGAPKCLLTPAPSA